MPLPSALTSHLRRKVAAHVGGGKGLSFAHELAQGRAHILLAPVLVQGRADCGDVHALGMRLALPAQEGEDGVLKGRALALTPQEGEVPLRPVVDIRREGVHP